MNEWVVTRLRLVIRLLLLPRALRREDIKAKVGSDDLLSGVSESVSESVCESVSDLIHDTYLHFGDERAALDALVSSGLPSSPPFTTFMKAWDLDYRVYHLLPGL